jgi:sialate O-acetylesterase
MKVAGYILISIVALAAVAMPSQAAELSLNRYFSSNMVLQRDKPLSIKGTAENGADVTVSFAGQTKSAKADASGNWVVTLDPVSASAKGAELKALSKGKTVSISNVVVGDVILHARQTNIDISLGRDEEGKKVASLFKANPMFRAICIKAIPSEMPLHDLAKDATAGWNVVDKDSALRMTASAFYVGRDLAKDPDVPVGIIDLNMGSQFGNSWLSREALLETTALYGDKSVVAGVTRVDAMLKAEREGKAINNEKTPPKNTIQDTIFPAGGYHGTLLPFTGIALKAVLLQLGNDYPYMRYQELQDSDKPFDYEEHSKTYKHVYNLRKYGFQMEDELIPRIPREWRKVLGDAALPFGLIVPPGSDLNTLGQHHREMRELQRLTAVDTPGTGIILPGTAHIPFSAQPADEALLAKRSLAWLEGAVYKKPGAPATGPLFDRFEANFNEATIYFKEGTAKGLKAEGRGALGLFEVANVEGDYAPAKARVDGETIRLESDAVTRIARVRYNWNQKPNQELVNAAGLPAIPFRSERAPYYWFVRNDSEDLPEEYFLPANQWKKNDVTLINIDMEKNGYSNFSGWIGPAGFRAGPFGPNMGVSEIKTGSPADGKLMVDDVVYSANGKMLGSEAWLVMADAITASETREGNGKLVLGVRRGTENIDVEITLPVMGTYSSTAPFECPKSEKIVENLVKWIESGKSMSSRKPDFLGTDTLFLLATGRPEYMGLVRRTIYDKMAKTKIPDKIIPSSFGGKSSWYAAWDALVLGEYYMATGDRNVLPLLKFNCDVLAAIQHPLGAWRHGFMEGGGYGCMPAIGLAAGIGFNLANGAGLDINQEAYRKAVRYHHDGSGEMGRILYGVGAGNVSAPREFEPEAVENGKMGTGNGALAAAAVLFDLEGKDRAAHLCSFISAHSWNNTFEGHGGNFFNNFWTPLGAKVQGKKSFIHFWEKYRWYRELGRNYDGSFNFDAYKDLAGYGIPLVAPRERLQIVGAPMSPFDTKAPAILKPALTAYWKKDYAGCEKLVNEVIASGSVSLKEMPTVEFLARAAREMPQSINADLARMQKLIDAKELYEASTFLAGVKGVMAADDERLLALQKLLADVMPPKVSRTKQAVSTERQPVWECLVMEAKSPSGSNDPNLRGPVSIPKTQEPNLWKLKVVENISQAPEGWFKPGFDDTSWPGTTLPTSWRMYHTALLRTRFTIENKNKFDALRLYSWPQWQQEIEVYLNGALIAKINGGGDTGNIAKELKASALKNLKNGENTLAIKTRHNWRWGSGGLSVYNNGFDFNLDARVKQ